MAAPDHFKSWPKKPSTLLIDSSEENEKGRGSYGCVHPGTLDGRPVAVKAIHLLLLQDPQNNRPLVNFEKECDILKSLQHRHIVNLLGNFIDFEKGNRPILVMELCKENLSQHLKRCKERLSRNLSSQLEISREITEGLCFLHDHNIVHRDLKLENILIGKDGCVRIGDFGQSKLVSHIGQDMSTQQPGTAIYMPPEALKEEDVSYDAKIDVFSLGVVFTCIATQREPRVGLYGIGQKPELKRRVQDLQPLTKPSGEHHPLEVLIRVCLQDNPEFRPDLTMIHNHLRLLICGTNEPQLQGNLKAAEQGKKKMEAENKELCNHIQTLEKNVQVVTEELDDARKVIAEQLEAKHAMEQNLKLQLKDKDASLQECIKELKEKDSRLLAGENKQKELRENILHLERTSREEQEKSKAEIMSQQDQISHLQKDLQRKIGRISAQKGEQLILELENEKLKRSIARLEVELKKSQMCASNYERSIREKEEHIQQQNALVLELEACSNECHERMMNIEGKLGDQRRDMEHQFRLFTERNNYLEGEVVELNKKLWSTNSKLKTKMPGPRGVIRTLEHSEEETKDTSLKNTVGRSGKVKSVTKPKLMSAKKTEPLNPRAYKETQTEVNVSDIGSQLPEEEKSGFIVIDQPGGSRSDTDPAERNTKYKMHKNATGFYGVPKLVEFSLQKNKHKLVFANSHFLYEDADIKIVAICSELGFNEPANKNLDEQLKGLLQQTIGRRYQKSKPDKFDVFTINCPPSSIGCSFLVVANVLVCNVERGQDNQTFLQQILHGVFKEADTLEMPKALVSRDSFKRLGFPTNVLLPTFIRMLSQYHFTNDDFLTEVKFSAASQDDLQNLVAMAEHTLGMKGHRKDDYPGEGLLLDSQNSEKKYAIGNVAKMDRSGSSKQKHNKDCCTNLDPGIIQLMLKCQMFNRDQFKCSADFTSLRVLGEHKSSQELANFIASYKSLAGGKGVVYDTITVQGPLNEDSLVMWISDLESKFPRVVFIPDISNQCVHLLSVDHKAISDIKRHHAATAHEHAQTQSVEGRKSARGPVVIQMGGQHTLTVKKGDLVREKVTAIVNAANEQLQHGSGVALAIDRASHGQVQWESNHVIKEAMKHRIPTGQVALTRAGGDLRCDAVIHAVGPDANMRKIVDCKGLLRQACENSLKRAEKEGMGSVAFPPISSGIYGMPKDLVAQILIDTILHFPYKHKSSLRDIRIVIIDDETLVPFLKYAQHVADATVSARSPPCENSTDSPVPATTSLAVDIPLEKSHRKLMIKIGHFLYEHTEIKIIAICSELGFAVGLNKDLNESLNGELKKVIERRYQNTKPDRFDVFTVHCPPTAIGCRFFVIANVLDRNLGNHQDQDKYLQQILHSVFKETDTLEMPTLAIAVNSFATVGFNAESVLPSFVRMFNHYQFTNNEFLTDVRFLAHSENGFNELVSTVERCLGRSLQPPISKLPVTVDEEATDKDQNQGYSWPEQKILGYAAGASWKALNPFSHKNDPHYEESQVAEVVIPLSATCTLTVKKGNIIEERTTAIVNPTTTYLKHDNGVAAAINNASNGLVQKESDDYIRRRRGGLLQPGGVAVTAAGGNLHCKHIIHAVGPDARKLPMDKCKELLEQTCYNILQCATDPEKQITSIALPSISSGIYVMPKDVVAQVLIDSILRYPYMENCLLVDIRIVIIDSETLQPFLHYVQEVMRKHEPTLKEDRRHSPLSTSHPPPVVTVKSPASSTIIVKATKKADNQMDLDREDIAIPQISSHRKLFVTKGHFLYVNADIKVVAISSEMGFDRGINKNVNEQLKGSLKQTVDRRYQNGKPDKFDVFTVHCPPSTIACRFLVVANIVDRTFGKGQDNHKHLQQILHSVFKEADTLEMPTVAIAPTTFALGGFSRDSILPAFVAMFNQYKFTNDDFLTDVKFIATAEEFPLLRAFAERSTTSMTVSKLVSTRGSGQPSQSKQPEVAAAVVTGDIVQFPADAIVVPISPSLDMRGATSQAVNDASNGEVLRQCSHLRGNLVEGKVVSVTCKAEWNIQARFLYLLVRSRSTRRDTLKQACTQALQTAKAHSLSSIAFPPVTTHKGKEEIAKAMHEVFTIFQQQQSQSDLTITVVIKKDDTAIHEAFKRCFHPTPGVAL